MDNFLKYLLLKARILELENELKSVIEERNHLLESLSNNHENVPNDLNEFLVSKHYLFLKFFQYLIRSFDF